jgi:hypothetical protein
MITAFGSPNLATYSPARGQWTGLSGIALPDRLAATAIVLARELAGYVDTRD